MISTGNQELDKHIGGYNNELVMIYGPGGSGKTTLALTALLGQSIKKKRIIFIDTENRFPVERLKQLSMDKDIFDSILLLRAGSFKEQTRLIARLGILVGNTNTNLVVIDSIGYHYRLELEDNYSYANKTMSRQLSKLSQLAREHDTTILMTNQVYSMDNNIYVVGGNMMLNWSKTAIELRKGAIRHFVMKKPVDKTIGFRIVRDGIEILK